MQDYLFLLSPPPYTTAQWIALDPEKDRGGMTLLEETIPAAERVLTDVFGESIELADPEGLGGSNRSHVHRCSVRPQRTDLPSHVVVKKVATGPDQTYDPSASDGPAWRLFNEWAGLQFLTELAGAGSPAPQFYGGDRDAGLIVLEDLGSGRRLDQLLLGADRSDAMEGLMSLMTALARMHAVTIGHRATFDRLRGSLGPTPPEPEPEHAVEAEKSRFLALTTAAGVTPSSGIDDDFRALQGFLAADGPFMAYSHRDPCPDNCLLVGGEMKLVDFEFGAYRHALRDAVYGRIHFPTCWCVNRLPVEVYEEMERVYQRELARGCAAAGDVELFNRSVVEACVWELLRTLNVGLLETDGEWGIATMRQRALVRLDRVSEAAGTVSHLEGLGATVGNLAEALRRQWPAEADAMPLYPAFR